MSKHTFHSASFTLAVILVAGGLYGPAPAQAVSYYRLPEVASVSVNYAEIYPNGKPVKIQCDFTLPVMPVKLLSQQEHYLALYNNKKMLGEALHLPYEIRADGKKIKSSYVSNSWGYFMHGGMKTSSSWTPSASDAGRKHKIACIIDPRGWVHSTTKTTFVKVLSLRLLHDIPGMNRSRAGQSKPASGLGHAKSIAPLPGMKEFGGKRGRPQLRTRQPLKSPPNQYRASKALGNTILLLPDLSISELRVVNWTCVYEQGVLRNLLVGARVINTGNSPATVPFSVELTAGTNKVIKKVPGGLAPHSSVWVTGELKGVSGYPKYANMKLSYTFHAKADSAGTIKEIQEQNNERSAGWSQSACGS